MQRVRSTRDILIQTERSDEARAFYEGVLGFSVIHDDPAMCGLDTGSFNLFIDPAPSLGPVLEFEVGDLAETKAQLLGAGCSVIEEDPAIPRCYIRDPFGLIFNLREVVPSSGAEPGRAADPRFERQNLAGAVFQDCSLARAAFDDVNLFGAQFSNVLLDQANFTNIKSAGVTIDDVDLSGARFSDVRLDHATFTNVSLAGVTIDDANIAGLTIFGHDIQGLISTELARRREHG